MIMAIEGQNMMILTDEVEDLQGIASKIWSKFTYYLHIRDFHEVSDVYRGVDATHQPKPKCKILYRCGIHFDEEFYIYIIIFPQLICPFRIVHSIIPRVVMNFFLFLFLFNKFSHVSFQ